MLPIYNIPDVFLIWCSPNTCVDNACRPIRPLLSTRATKEGGLFRNERQYTYKKDFDKENIEAHVRLMKQV